VHRVEVTDDGVHNTWTPGRLLEFFGQPQCKFKPLSSGFELSWLPGVVDSKRYVQSIPLRLSDQRRRNGGDGPKKRSESLRLRGTSLRDRAIALAKEQDVVTTREFGLRGVHRCYLLPMCREGLLVRVDRGRYRLAPLLSASGLVRSERR
jgi:hypothetical protein